MTLFGESELYLRFALALSVVLGLIVLCTWAMKYLKTRQLPWGTHAPGRRLQLLETLILDDKRRIVLIKDGIKEYLIMLGSQGETILNRSDRSEADVKKLRLKKGRS